MQFMPWMSVDDYAESAKIYAMIFLHAFQFTVTRARHCICHDNSLFISVQGYASTALYMPSYFFMHFSLRLRQHAETAKIYAMVLLYSFQFTVTRAMHCICHNTSLFISVHGYASTALYTP